MARGVYLYSWAGVWGAGNNGNRGVLGAGTGAVLQAGTDRLPADRSSGPENSDRP